MEGQRIRNAGTVDFREPIYGYRSPSPLWVFCALVHGGRHLPKALGFSDDASRLHDLKRLSLFRRDKVPARNTHRPSGFAFTHLKKFLRVPRGVFSKTLLGRVWDSVPQRESEPAHRGAPFQAGRGPCTKHRQTVRLCLYAPKKVFEGSKGRFFKNAPLAGCGTASHKRRASQPVGVRLFRRDEVPARNTDRPSGFAFTPRKKFLRVPRGVFPKTRPWQGVGQRPTKGGRASHRGVPFQGGGQEK